MNMAARIMRAGAAGVMAALLAWMPLAEAASSKVEQAAAKAVQAVAHAYKNKGTAAIDDWTLIALSLLGEDVQTSEWGGSIRWQTELHNRLESLDLRKTTDYARFAMAVSASGEDPSQFGGVNLIARLQHVQLANGKFADSMDGTGQSLINAHVWSIIALYAAGEQIPRAKQAKAWLVSKQLPDGGFQFATEGKTGGIDMTAMTLIAFKALGMSKEEQPVKKALAFLRTQQKDGGGYADGGVANVESVATVISALIAWGENPESWKKGTGSTVDNLLSYQKADGTFSHTKGGPSNQIATAQAMLGISDVKRGGPYVIKLRESAGQRKVAHLYDLDRSHWAFGEISYLVKNGYLQGVTATRMSPDQQVTRAQFAVLLLRAIGEGPVAQPQGKFADVPQSGWAAPYVEKAAALGLMQGSGSLFRPDQGITQEEMASIAARIATKYKWTKTYSGAGTVPVDWARVSSWAVQDVKVLQKQKLLGATASRQFVPKAAVTRAEAAALLYRLLAVR
ncbi:S-layer homology domain-containing protein [Brevibacillus fluminis]|uniref:S-layer homology domain-containing protein n=1 Tax=Brevibacillus fluminis TaxID=511487 RepID=UPI003F889069